MNQVRIAGPAALEAHATIAGRSTHLSQVVERTRAVRGRDPVEWLVTVTPETVHRIESLYLLAAENGIAVRFAPTGDMDEREAAFLADFLRHRMPRAHWSPRGLLDSLGDVSMFLIQVLKTVAGSRPTRAVADGRSLRRLARAVLIGVYGGDHVGDAAILGGVLQHLHSVYGTIEADVLSHRPEHTRRLAAGLETPVHLGVHRYEAKVVEQLLDDADALVLAGGPLMDLPRVLVRHLAVVRSARRRGRPFLIERVGVGPFRRRASRWAARRIARAATIISVRSRTAAADPVLDGLTVAAGVDPAFDYLATRHELTLLKGAEADSIDALLRGTDNRLRVGINLRPIRHLWSTRGAAYSEAMEHRFYERLSKALIGFSRTAPRPVSYVFFPMNPLQFGSSDLASAFRLHRLVAGAVDLRVWEFDPDVDGVLHLVRQLDVAVAMRFHACIFALSQKVPVLGVDYYPGQGGKVEELFRDLGRPDDMRRIDTADTNWLVTRLQASIPRVKGRG